MQCPPKFDLKFRNTQTPTLLYKNKHFLPLSLLWQSFESPEGLTPRSLGVPCQLFIYYMSKIVVLGVRFWPPYPPSVDVAANNHRPFGPCLNTAPLCVGVGTFLALGEGLSLGGEGG